MSEYNTKPHKNGNGNGGIIEVDGLVNTLKNPEEVNLKKVVCGLMLKDNFKPEILAIYNILKQEFELPGGKLEPNDYYSKKTLVREIEEELGISVEIDEHFEARYKLNVRNEPRMFKLYLCRYNIDTLPEKPVDPQFSEIGFIPMLECNTRSDVSPLILHLCQDLIPFIKKEGINLNNYKKSE